MADDVDRAAVLTQAWTERCVGAHLRQLHQPGTLDCDICGEPIPARRRQAQPTARTCLPCQEAMEVRRGR